VEFVTHRFPAAAELSVPHREQVRLEKRRIAEQTTEMITQYVTDEQGRKTRVLLSIDQYERLLEDLEDLAAIAERRSEATVSHTELIEELRRDGLLPN